MAREIELDSNSDEPTNYTSRQARRLTICEVPIYLIGAEMLPRGKEARSRLRSLGIECSPVKAVFPLKDGKGDFSDKLFIERYGREALPGEIGCLLSHRRALEAFLRSDDDWCIILEDDVKPTPQLGELLLSAPPSLKGAEMLLLGHSRTLQKNLWFQRLKQPLSETVSWGSIRFGLNEEINRCGTVGYAINREAASKWLSTGANYLTDDFEVLRNIGVNVHHPFRPVVYEDLSFESQIGNRPVVQHDLISGRFLIELSTLLDSVARRFKRGIIGRG